MVEPSNASHVQYANPFYNAKCTYQNLTPLLPLAYSLCTLLFADRFLSMALPLFTPNGALGVIPGYRTP